MPKKRIVKFTKDIFITLLALVLCVALCPLPALGNVTKAIEDTDEEATSDTGNLDSYTLITQAEANGDCTAGEALVVYHASGATKGSTGTLSIQSDDDPLFVQSAAEGFEVAQTWDLSAADSADAADEAASDGALSVQSIDGDTLASGSDVRVALVKNDSMSVADLVSYLDSLDYVECAAPNYEYEPLALTDDTYGDLQYGLISDTAGIGYSSALKAEKAAGSKIGTNVVAVCDTGVDYTNPDLAGQMWTDPGDIGLGEAGSHGYNGNTGVYDPMPGEGSGFAHGTHCAGIIAAQSDNTQGVASIAGSSKHTQIMGLRISNDNGSLTETAIAGAYEYLVRAALAGVNVVAVNNSWGNSYGSAYNPVLDYLVNQAGKAGVISCFAAGNEGVDNANYYDTCQLQSPYAIVVAANNSKNRLSSYTCYNATGVDVAAPGSCILSTITNSTSRYFDALLTRESGDYNASTNPYGRADRLSYYTDIASLKNAKDVSSDANDFQVSLVDSDGNRLPDAMQGYVTVTTKDENGAALTFGGQDAVKLSIDYPALAAADYKFDKVFANVTWTISNPFKGMTDMTASEYTVNTSGELLGDVNDKGCLVIRPYLYGKDASGAKLNLVDYHDLKNDPSYIIISNDFVEFDNGTLYYTDTTSDTLGVEMNCGLYDPSGEAGSSVESFLLTAYGIGKNTDPSKDITSAHVPYGYMTGTSMATPMISGCIGELAALYPDDTALELRGLICGGTTTLSREGDEDKIASGGRFTFDVALDEGAVNANTWSITTERNIVTVHGYGLLDAKLYIDGSKTAVVPSSQTDDSITFTADTAIFDGTTHRFDVTDTSTGRTYKASYVVPNEAADSLSYVRNLPVTDQAADDSLIASADCLYLGDGLGTYLYGIANPSDKATAWTQLAAPGSPWKAAGETDAGNNRGAIAYTYCNGKLYAFADGDSTVDISGSVLPVVVVYNSVYDIATDTWSPWVAVSTDVSLAISGLTAGVYNGSVYCAVSTNLGPLGSFGLIAVQQADGTYKTDRTYNDDGLLMPYKAFGFGDTLYAFSATESTDTSTQVSTYQPILASLTQADYDETAESFIFRNAAVISGLDKTTDSFLTKSLMTDAQTTTDKGIVVAMNRSMSPAMGDLLLVNIADGSIVDLGSYGIGSSAGYVANSMVDYNGTLYIDAVDRTLGSAKTGIYTIPEAKSANISAQSVDALASSTNGGTATVEDWHGKATDTVTMVTGDIATWKATADEGYMFVAWYDESGNFVSRDATYSTHVDKDYALEARFADGSRITRLSGPSALDTATAIIGEGDFNRGGTVVLATINNFPDALTAAGIAGLANAPVLLTDGTVLSGQTTAQLALLKPSTIIVCGGASAISDSVAADAQRVANAANLYRCAGSSRSGTACEIYKNAKTYTGSSFDTTAFITTGTNFADALAAAPYSYAKHCPVFLTESDGTLSDATVATMVEGGITDFYILGGKAAVSSDVVEQLLDKGITFNGRLAGSTRYETGEKIAEFELANGLSANDMALATGSNYKDALTGAALCGRKGSILLLVSDTDRTAIDKLVKTNKDNIGTAYVFGGTASVSEDTEAYLEDALDPID